MARHIRHFSQMSAVTDIDWIRRIVGLESTVFPMVMRHFPLAEEDVAWNWLNNG